MPVAWRTAYMHTQAIAVGYPRVADRHSPAETNQSTLMHAIAVRLTNWSRQIFFY
jgi:hypothetical protein